jgi:peptide chain release factor subunit 1
MTIHHEMTTETLGIDTLERLSGLATHGHPVLSVYVDLDPSRFPTPAARDAQLGSLLGDAQRDAAEQDLDDVQKEVELIKGTLLADPAITRGADALAIFSCAEAGILDAVRLPSPVEPMAVIDTVPWLEPLAGMISPGDWCVAVVSRRDARLLRGGPRGLAQFAAIHDELHRRHAQGGWSQTRFQRGIEEQVAWHVRGVAHRLLRAHRRRPFEHLVIIASDELRPVIERSLHADLTRVLAATVDADLEHASVEEIAQAVEPVIERAARERERALVDVLEQGLGTGGTAAAGLDEVLSMLEQQRVDTLLVPERSTLVAGLCPRCGRLSIAGDGRCPLDGAVLAEVDAVEHAVERAAGQSAQVVVVRHGAGWLSEHGQIAARLRW